MRAMAEKDWMEDIMFLCRLSGRTMNRDTAISSSTRKMPVTLRGNDNTALNLQTFVTVFWGERSDGFETNRSKIKR